MDLKFMFCYIIMFNFLESFKYFAYTINFKKDFGMQRHFLSKINIGGKEKNICDIETYIEERTY